MDIQTFMQASYVGTDIDVSLIVPDKSERDTLMVLLPGRGYKIDAPLLFYHKMLAWQLGYDTLLIEYGFHVAQADFELGNIPQIHNETQQIIEQALASHEYKNIIFVGKSLGTPIAAMLANTYDKTSKVILLTPIQRSQEIVQKAPTLAVIGTADRVYDADMIVDTDIVTWAVYEGLDHALHKPNDLMHSLEQVQHIMARCEDFLTS